MTGSGDEAAPRPTVFADDLVAGQRIELAGYRVEHAEVVEFAGQWDDQWFHTDDAAAAQGHFGGVIASGIHTLAIMQKLLVEAVFDSWAVIAGRGFDTLRFVEAVRPGDTLSGSVEIGEVVLDGQRGTVPMHLTMTNQHGRTVLAGQLTVMLHRRQTASD